MSHAYDLNVLGGVGKPVFYVADGINFCDNPYMDTGITGWTESLAGILSQYGAEDEALGEYCGKIEYAVNEQYVEFTYNYGGTIEGLTFVVLFRAKSSAAFKACFAGASEFGCNNFAESNVFLNYVMVESAKEQSGTEISFRLYGTQNDTESAELYFDDVFFALVDNTLEMPQPQESYLTFDRKIYGTNELWNGRIQEFCKRWKPGYYANWEYLEPEYEIYRQKIANGSKIVCKPHTDIDWGLLGSWDEDFERRYFRNRFLAHTGLISLKGLNLITGFPAVQSSEEPLYIYADELII